MRPRLHRHAPRALAGALPLHRVGARRVEGRKQRGEQPKLRNAKPVRCGATAGSSAATAVIQFYDVHIFIKITLIANSKFVSFFISFHIFASKGM